MKITQPSVYNTELVTETILLMSKTINILCKSFGISISFSCFESCMKQPNIILLTFVASQRHLEQTVRSQALTPLEA